MDTSPLRPGTRNGARADALESRKRELDAQIANIRAVMRELPIEYDSKAYALYVSLDREIDALLLEKDNIPDTLFAGWGEPSEEYKNSQPYHSNIYPFF